MIKETIAKAKQLSKGIEPQLLGNGEHLKPVCSAFFVNRPPILALYFRFSVKPCGSFYLVGASFWQTSSASFRFFNHPFNEISLFFAIDREHYPISEVYNSVIGLASRFDFGFFGCGCLHNGKYRKFLNEFREAA
jgi:hypothetical protein